MSTRTGEAAISWGRDQITDPSQSWYQLCLMFVRSCFGVGRLFPNAGSAWDGAQLKHRTTNPMDVPRGAPGFIELASVEDHTFLGLGGGLCLTNDFGAGNNGKIVVARIADICTRWNGTLLGWTEDLNGERVYTPPATAPKADPATPREKRILELFRHIRNQWVNERIADRAAMSELQRTGSPRFAQDVDECGDAIDDAMHTLLTGSN